MSHQAGRLIRGSLFPWKTLYENGIGAWYDEADVDALRKTITAVPSVEQVKADLRTYGYGVDAADDAYKAVVNFSSVISPRAN